MSAPPPWSPPSGGAIASDSEPDSPSSGSFSSTPSSPAPAPGGGSSVASSSSPSSSTPPPPPAARAGKSAAPPTPPGCAACKHKRQKCPPGCILLPYFPADDPDKFRNVLRVFGVKNLLRTLRDVPQPRWGACVRTIVYESKARLMDPVRGCVGVIEDLEGQLVDTAIELEVLRRRQEAYRQAKRRLQLQQPPNPTHGRSTASPRGITNLDAARQLQQSGRTTSVDMMQPQGPYGNAWSPATTGLTAAQPQLLATQPHLSETQPQFSVMRPHQFPGTQPHQFPGTQPQQRAMHRQTATRGATAMLRDDFGGDAWANDERDDPDDM
ncbi:hypothetical protein BAE44_0008609 [Dichanthelium oligosanthes]|uniref:LOB domain-containing protein n=1 Tax=Dichanthelium oligosanthes TaxID=888268 RepID=A0A1E5VZ07_9POAL|nr:hypothetical protein BAE44_0008609 [Dichanthelium oligosanthes]